MQPAGGPTTFGSTYSPTYALICGARATVAPVTSPTGRNTVSAPRKPLNFEKSLADLEALVERMEEGELSLEESLKAFESGIRLTQQCQQALTQAQQRVQLLAVQDGEVRATPFAEADDADEDADV